jgi:hypothetical protein
MFVGPENAGTEKRVFQCDGPSDVSTGLTLQLRDVTEHLQVNEIKVLQNRTGSGR